ncbi:MAG: hypothetical protein ACRDV1_12165 [Actinomycetes bacterium]
MSLDAFDVILPVGVGAVVLWLMLPRPSQLRRSGNAFAGRYQAFVDAEFVAEFDPSRDL